jgi:hypothetical protein
MQKVVERAMRRKKKGLDATKAREWLDRRTNVIDPVRLAIEFLVRPLLEILFELLHDSEHNRLECSLHALLYSDTQRTWKPSSSS